MTQQVKPELTPRVKRMVKQAISLMNSINNFTFPDSESISYCELETIGSCGMELQSFSKQLIERKRAKKL